MHRFSSDDVAIRPWPGYDEVIEDMLADAGEWRDADPLDAAELAEVVGAVNRRASGRRASRADPTARSVATSTPHGWCIECAAEGRNAQGVRAGERPRDSHQAPSCVKEAIVSGAKDGQRENCSPSRRMKQLDDRNELAAEEAVEVGRKRYGLRARGRRCIKPDDGQRFR